MNGDLHLRLKGNNVRASRQMLSSPRNKSRRATATMGPAMDCGADLMGFRSFISQSNLGMEMEGLCQQKANKRGWEECEKPVDVCVQKVRVTATKKRKPRRARNSRTLRHSNRGVNNAPDNTNEFLFSDRKENKEDVKEMTGADFMSREFTREYEEETRNKQRMGKEDLINEYMMMEKAVSSLEKRMEEVTTREEMKALYGDVGYEWEKGEMHMEPDTAEKIRIFQEEISRLIQENSGLGGDNVRLRQENQAESKETSGDSSETSGHSSDSSDSEDSQHTDNQSKRDDTGYESDRSWGSGKEIGIRTVSSTCGS